MAQPSTLCIRHVLETPCMQECRPTPGALLNARYEPVKTLNHGSYGVVSLARDISTGGLVAIKIMMNSGANSNMAHNEIAMHARLDAYPHIVNLLDSFESDSYVFLVFEYCPLGDLYEAIINGRGPGETEHVRAFMLQLIDAVEYAHSRGVYHRDIKPENIFLTACGDVKLGDFGLSTTEAATSDVGIGSDRYMPPEQFDNSGQTHEPIKADYWAVGITLLNILFGRNPFKTTTDADPLWCDYLRNRETLYDVFPSMSSDTFEALQHVLVCDPSRRDLQAFRAAVEQVREWTSTEVFHDEFASDEVVAPVATTANRQPLRTPSIQTAIQSISLTSFPWAKALSNHRHQVIMERLAEDSISLNSSKTSPDSRVESHPSVDSGLGASLQSVTNKLNAFRMDTLASSLPTKSVGTACKTRRNRAHLQFVKSWSDWVEEETGEYAGRTAELASTSGKTSSVDAIQETDGEDEDWLPQWED